MNPQLTLFLADVKEIKSWFKNEAVGKLFVVLGFAVVFIIVLLTIYVFTEIYFRTLSTYQQFGILAARYLFHTGFLILFFLITTLSSFSFITFIFSSRKKIENLLVLPLSIETIPLWYFLRSVIVSFLLFALFLFPLVISFYRHFLHGEVLSFLLLYLVMLAVVSLLSTAIGSFIGYLMLRCYTRYKKLSAVGGAAILTGMSYFLFRMIFPSELKLLYNASSDKFEMIYNSLPLSNALIPSLWVVRGIIEENIFFLLPFLSGAVLISVLVIHVLSRGFRDMYQQLGNVSGSGSSPRTFDSFIVKTKNPLLYKDWLSIVRVPQEIGYGGFLLILVSLFFLFISFSQRFSPVTFNQRSEIVVFSFIALLFFATAYTLRIVFPLMAREGRAAWYIFTLPISSKHTLQSKILLGILLIMPYVLFSLALWMMLKVSYPLEITGYSLFLLLCISIVNASMGAIYPNFHESENAEKISTSGMGILCLLISFFLITLGGYFLNMVLQNNSGNWLSIIPGIVMISGITAGIYFLSLKLTRKYLTIW